VTASSVNNTDVWTRQGAYGTPADPDAVAGWKGEPLTFPRIQGGDAVGHVVATGGGVDRAIEGRRVLVDPIVYGRGEGPEPPIEGVLGSEEDGAFAEFLCVAAGRVHDVTASPLDDAQLACLPIAYGTAAGMLDRADLSSGDRLLVTGASGGVGLALVQLGAALGAEVAAVTSAASADAVLAAGARTVVVRDAAEDLAGAIAGAVGNDIDIVADVVGGPLFGELLDLLGTGGRLVTCGAVAGPVVQLDLRVLYLRRRRIVGSTMHTPTQFQRLIEAVNEGRIDPVVARTYPLADIHRAQHDFLAGDFVGKLVLLAPRPGSDGRAAS
jgi:NADPH:quinone reductase-like Zn-dependent oxidoreductase